MGVRECVLFTLLIALVITQRIIELIIAKRNERWILSKGGYEVGAAHYPFMLLMHSTFFIMLFLEVTFLERSQSFLWLFFLILFLIAQLGRFWCLYSLGKLWNTKIMILPNITIVREGPYRLFKHPNYFIVAVEFITFPLLFNAYLTAILFSLLNLWILSIRIPIEENALKEVTNYETIFIE